MDMMLALLLPGITNAFLHGLKLDERPIFGYTVVLLIPVFVICCNYLYRKKVTSVIAEIAQLIVNNHAYRMTH